jgi:Uma2 family endonuclease
MYKTNGTQNYWIIDPYWNSIKQINDSKGWRVLVNYPAWQNPLRPGIYGSKYQN